MPQKIPPKSAGLLFIIGLAIGLLITSQLRTPPQRITNPLAPFLVIEKTRNDLKQANESLKSQIKSLRLATQDLQDQAKKRKSNIKSLVEIIDQLKESTGLTEKVGQGLVITLDDARGGETTVDSIVHAADLRDLVNALWVADAEAISINDERLVATSSIDSIHNAIIVNNVRMNPPFIVKVRGNYPSINPVLATLPTLADLRNRSKNLGLIFHIEGSPEVTIKEFTGTFSIKLATVKE